MSTRIVDILARAGERAGLETAPAGNRGRLTADDVPFRIPMRRDFARSMTQQQVADKMGVTKGRVSQIEQGKISGHA
ncbi:MAG: helix-turn-helix domain-containing protein [Pseudonocardiaceae bacterium]